MVLTLTFTAGGSDECALSIGDNVVWLSDDYPELGVVQWTGKLSETSGWMVGVEFVSDHTTLSLCFNLRKVFCVCQAEECRKGP